MGVQTMGSHGHGLGQQLQLMPLARQTSWFSLTLDEVENQLGHLGKPLGSMNIDELLKNVWTTETNQAFVVDTGDASSASALQRQASLLLARAFSGKTVDEVWRDIQLGQKMKNMKELSQEREPTLGETTLEDFLVKAGLFVGDSSLGPVMGLDNTLTPQNFTSVGLSPSPSIDALSDTTIPGWKRDASDIDKTLDRRLRRKIKNRESAARSRARKQAYHNELVGKVSRLEEENMKLKKEKERSCCRKYLAYNNVEKCYSEVGFSLLFGQMSLIESAAEKYVTKIVDHFFFCIPLSSHNFVSPRPCQKASSQEGFNFLVLLQEFDETVPPLMMPSEPRYQLRRTTSF